MTFSDQQHLATPAISSTVRAASVASAAVNGESSKVEDKTGDVNGITDIRLNVFEKARTVTSVCTSGTLCTVSSYEGIEGSPFGSFVDYVLDDEGNPVLLMNEMSMHTINIEKAAENSENSESMVTLFTQFSSQSQGTAGSGGKSAGLQDTSRCSLTGAVEKIPKNAEDMDVIRMRYSLAHTYADQVMDSPKFAFYRLKPKMIYFVGGFGVSSKWVDVEQYKKANPDILAKEAAEIVQRMNREHNDDLQLTAQYLLDIPEVVKVVATGVDRLGIDLRVTSKMGTRRNKLQTDEFRIGFRIPVISVEDAKSEILKVFQEAWEKGNGISWGDEEEPGSDIPMMKIAVDALE